MLLLQKEKELQDSAVICAFDATAVRRVPATIVVTTLLLFSPLSSLRPLLLYVAYVTGAFPGQKLWGPSEQAERGSGQRGKASP